MRKRSLRLVGLVRTAALAVSGAALALVASAGCSSKMEEKDCTKLKIESFDILNKAQHCNTDVDCKGSLWPDCAKPLSQTNADEIKKKQDAYFTGKCEEAKPDCSKDTTPIYCKQGLCVRKEKGTPESAGETPPGDIQVH
jgi:hypothetical protein